MAKNFWLNFLGSFQISHLIALAPIFHVKNVKGMLRTMVPYREGFQKFFDTYTNGSFMTSANKVIIILI